MYFSWHMHCCENFSRFYEDDGFAFHADWRVPYTACGPDGNLGLFDFLRMVTDLSSEDIYRRGTSMSFLVSRGYARVLARSAFRFYRMPRNDERIEFVTTEWKPESLQFVRDYKVKGEDGELLVAGLSKWLVTDFSTRKILPTRTLEKFRKLNTVPFEGCEVSCGKIPLPENLKKVAERKIERSQIDGNAHVDNAFYGAFIMDALPAEFAERKLNEFRINYARELLLGDVVEIHLAKTGENRVTVVGTKNGDVAFTGELGF